MTLPFPGATERLFPHYLDSVDGTLCVPASTNIAEVQRQSAPHNLRFPLYLDSQTTLSAQINAATHTPASHRFGPFCDNVIGMNWQLPTGRMVRIGERVVKTTTGYDWHRFLIHSGNRFGAPVDYVLRLRPACGADTLFLFAGDTAALSNAASTMLRSGWMHWFDALDFIAADNEHFLRLWVHTTSSERSLFENHLTRVADLTCTKIEIRRDASPPEDGLPDLVIKTTPDRSIDLAVRLSVGGARSIALCYSGVVHVDFSQAGVDPSHIESMIEPHLESILKTGGDWRSRHVPSKAPPLSEAAWIQILEGAVHGL